MNVSKKIWLSPPHMSGREMKYIQEAFESNWLAPAGPHLSAFENELANYSGVGHVAAVSSGTAALHLALLVLNVKRDDIVLCQSLTFAASANPIVYLGGQPVFIDSERETWNICPNALEDSLRHFVQMGKKPKAIIAVHLYGMPCKMNEILYLSQKYDVPLIEDAAEALGSVYQDRKVGSIGTMGVISFNGNKIITTSGGGALLSNEKSHISKALFLATQAREPAVQFEHVEIGYNYRMSNVCAGIGRGQLEVIEERVNKRRSNFHFYFQNLSTMPGISFQEEPKGSFSNRWLTALNMDPKKTKITSDKIRLQLAERHIESRPVWKPMHLQPLYKTAPYFGGDNAKNLFTNGLCLPSGTAMMDSDLERVSKIVAST